MGRPKGSKNKQPSQPWSPERLERLRQARQDPEYRARMSAIMKGRTRSPEHEAKLRLSRMHPLSVQYSIQVSDRVRSLKFNAEKRGLEWVLTDDQAALLVMSPCAYCGDQGSLEKPVGIDRVDNDRGYLLDNAVACCTMCNFGKRHYTVEKFIEWVTRVVNHSSAFPLQQNLLTATEG